MNLSKDLFELMNQNINTCSFVVFLGDAGQDHRGVYYKYVY